MQREPNTEYILSLSYGKDSIACLEAIKQLGYPLDRIVHAEVWATDDIPADLPPMVEFKKYADNVIKELYGIKVEHICAARGVKNSPTTTNSTLGLNQERTQTESMASHTQWERGVTADSKCQPLPPSLEKITYEKLFYHIPKRRKPRERERERWVATPRSRLWGKQPTQNGSTQTNQSSDSQFQEGLGATATSNLQPYGFPISIGRGNWCTQLKQRVFKNRPCTRRQEKYCAISRYSSR